MKKVMMLVVAVVFNFNISLKNKIILNGNNNSI